jgi:hypothetical protein
MKKESIRRWLLFIIGGLGLPGVIYLIWPMVSWYWEKSILVGTDFFLTGSYTGYLARHWAFPANAWKYIWYKGQPMILDYPFLLFYLLAIPAKIWGTVQAVKGGMIAGIVLFFGFYYLAAYRLSRNPLVSLLIVWLGVWSTGYYGALIQGGSLPYFFSQLFLPFIFIPLTDFWEKGQRRSLVWAGVITGISLLIHPQVGAGYLIPASFLFILLYRYGRNGIRQRFSNLFLYLLVVTGTGAPVILKNAFGLVLTVSALLGKSNQDVLESASSGFDLGIQKSLFWDFFIRVNPWYFVLVFALAVLVIVLWPIWGRRKDGPLIPVMPLAFMVGYTLLFLWAFVFRYNPLQGGWYRAYWPLMVFLGLLAAACWRQIFGPMRWYLTWLPLGLLVILIPYSSHLLTITLDDKGWLFSSSPIARWSYTSSAYPNVVNIITDSLSVSELKKLILPDWLPTDEKNYRLLDLDAEVNIWWNTFFDLPLVKGYIDPPWDKQRNSYNFLQDITLGRDETEKSYQWKPEAARNASLFFLDWAAAKYLEGGFAIGRSSPIPLSSFSKDPSLILKKEEKVNDPLKYGKFYMNEVGELIDSLDGYISGERAEKLTFYEMKDEVVSPIMAPVSQPIVALIGQPSAFELIYRVLAFLNLNSQRVITVNGPAKIDEWGIRDRKFDALIIHSYDYANRDKAFNALKQYVSEGGKVFIETGSEVRDSQSENLPDFFPIKKTQRSELGETWQLEGISKLDLSDLKTDDFGELTLDGQSWKMSWAESEDLIGEPLLWQKGKVILARQNIGKGTVIWSGANLFYHTVTYSNYEEAKLLGKMLDEIIPKTDSVAVGEVNWISSQKRMVSYQQARGILFKETYFSGWHFWWKKGAIWWPRKIYKVGPTSPGYMFAFTSEKEGKAMFWFTGTFDGWVKALLPLITILLTLSYLLFPGRLLHAAAIKIGRKFKHRFHGWWGKDEDY